MPLLLSIAYLKEKEPPTVPLQALGHPEHQEHLGHRDTLDTQDTMGHLLDSGTFGHCLIGGE